ncbi:hypothetical protein, partial [uncultured Dialister sp.]|uniref:hypothetical protein n=1 Tax=uncultured Dialister sp. TaxID=278064 RepID=UPI0025979214
ITTLISGSPLKHPGLKKMRKPHLREFQKILIKVASSSSNARFLLFGIFEQFGISEQFKITCRDFRQVDGG